VRRILAGLIVALIVGGRLTAQAPAPAVPTLTDLQRVTLGYRVLAQRNATLELELLVRELAQPGYTLDVNAGIYVPAEEKRAP